VRHFALFLTVFFVTPLAVAETFVGRVVGIADGDTLTILDATNQQHKVRLSGIDAPEKAQPFGNVSKQNLARLAFGRGAVADCPKRDRYGRQVCLVRVDGVDVGLAQVEAGLAWWYRKYAKEQSAQDRATYAAVEQDAQEAKRGLWRDKDPVPPWEWRHRGRQLAAAASF
jgi:endonuclease YncB( thermonuclease family)